MDYQALQEIVQPILGWYDRNARKLPWRETKDPYCIWVSEIMLQQTRVETVKAYYRRFIRRVPDLRTLAALPSEELSKLWEGLGYYTRARNLQRAAQVICDQHHAVFPRDYHAVRALPGIGDYTAGAILSIAFDLPYPAVDGNVLRVITRLTADDRNIDLPAVRREIQQRLQAIYPAGRCGDLTQSLMELGALICLPNAAPQCGECPLASLCTACAQNRQTAYPVHKEKPERKKQAFTVFLARRDGRLALRKRQQEGLLYGLWEPVNTEGLLSEKEASQWLHAQGFSRFALQREPDQKHIFTHIEWQMRVFSVNCEGDVPAGLVWADPEEVQNVYTLPTAFSKFLRKK